MSFDFVIPEDLQEDYNSALKESRDMSREKLWRDAMGTIVGYIERIARAEASLVLMAQQHAQCAQRYEKYKDRGI